MRVTILDDYQGVALESTDWSALDGRCDLVVQREFLPDEAAVVDCLASSEVAVAMRERTKFPRSVIERLPNLRLLVTTGPVNASIDLEAARDHGVVVCGTGGLPYPAAELTWGLILALLRRIPAEDAAVRAGRWQIAVGEGLRGKTLGLLGLGRLGGQVATVGRAFGMEVEAWSEHLTRERTDELGVTLAPSKEALLEHADVVTVHLQLSARTRGLVGAAELARMRPSAYLVNTSRSPIVDEGALVEALRAGTIAGAALDVFDREPLPAGHPLLALDNVVLTPHTGYVTKESYGIYYRDAVEDIVAFLDGAPVRVLKPAGSR